MRQFAVGVRFVAFLGQPCVKRKTATSSSRDYLAAFVRQTQGLIDSSPTLTPCKCVGQSFISRLPYGCLATFEHRSKIARKMNMLKILRTTLRQPCDLAKRKMVLRLPHEIPLKCDRRQVYGCRKADVKRA